MKNADQQAWGELGRTEVMKNNLNPVFMKSFEVTWMFEMRQDLEFFVYDVDNNTATLDDDDFLGSASCQLGEFAVHLTSL